jgi:integrase
MRLRFLDSQGREGDARHIGGEPARFTLYDLRATGITWEALAGTERLTIMQRAGHEDSKTTLGYVREADAVGLGQEHRFRRSQRA